MTCPAIWCFRVSGQFEQTGHRCTGIRQGVPRNTGAELAAKDKHGRDMEIGELTEAFEEAWSSAVSEAALRDLEDTTKPARIAQVGPNDVQAPTHPEMRHEVSELHEVPHGS